MTNCMKSNLKKMIAYLENGCKKESDMLGVMVEHFVVKKDSLEAVLFSGENGIETIIKTLGEKHDDAVITYQEGRCSGYVLPDYKVCISPGGQVAFICNPMSSVVTIGNLHEAFLKELDEHIAPLGYIHATCGYQPKTLAKDIELVPGKRFEFLDEYFKEAGSMGENMMKATATCQVTVNYRDEDDFSRKYQAAYLLTPALKLLTDNCPYFEGEENKSRIMRTRIWSQVDKFRCAVVPEIFAEKFHFKSYVSYLWNTPPIVIKNGDEFVYTGQERLAESYKHADIDEDAIDFITSMVFPEVRVRNGIQIRSADAMEGDMLLAYLAYIKGLMYSEDFLDTSIDFISDNRITEDDLYGSEGSLLINGWDGMINGIEAYDLIKITLGMAKAGLSEDEVKLLEPIKNIYKANRK